MSVPTQETGGEFIAIGKGAIGAEAIDQQLANDPALSLAFVQDRTGIRDAREAPQNGHLGVGVEELPMLSSGGFAAMDELQMHKFLGNVQFALEATPYNQHEMLAELIPALRKQNIFTVMASKGFMAEHPEAALEVYQAGYLGPDATLGGNTGIFPLFENVSDDRTVGFEGIVNGTFSRMFDLARRGKTPEEILPIVLPRSVEHPRGEGLAEPGAKNVLEVLHGEHSDNIGKAVNAYNFGILPNDSGDIDSDEIARVNDAEVYKITEEQAEELFAEPEEMAYVVNWHRDGGEIPHEYYDPSKVPGVFMLEVGTSGLIVGGFRRLAQTSPMHVITQQTGPLNGMAITKKIKPGRAGWDNHIIIGTGAGPIPTAHRMVLNARHLRERHGLI